MELLNVVKVLSPNVQNTWIMQYQVLQISRMYASSMIAESKLSGLVLIAKTTGVEPTEVEDCFTEDTMLDCPDDQNCNKFADYLLENYNEQFYTSHPTIFIFN